MRARWIGLAGFAVEGRGAELRSQFAELFLRRTTRRLRILGIPSPAALTEQRNHIAL
jgi:hypothetical protein